MTDTPQDGQEDGRAGGAARRRGGSRRGQPPSVAEPEEEPAPRRRSRRRKKGAKAPPPAAVSARGAPRAAAFPALDGARQPAASRGAAARGDGRLTWTRAADQYHSLVAFSIRSEDPGSAASGLLGAITQIGSASASDPDIVYEYIRSQKIVEEIDAATRPARGSTAVPKAIRSSRWHRTPRSRICWRSGTGWSRSLSSPPPASSTCAPTPSPPGRPAGDRPSGTRRERQTGEPPLRPGAGGRRIRCARRISAISPRTTCVRCASASSDFRREGTASSIPPPTWPARWVS